jgi:puromycin-sensitive aminopeptidase
VLLVALVKLGHDKTINEGVRRFSIFAHDRNTSLLPPDTRKVLPFFLTLYDALAFYLPHIYCDVLQAAYFAAMQNVTTSHRSAYNDLLKVYKESDEAEERGRVLSMWLFNNP